MEEHHQPHPPQSDHEITSHDNNNNNNTSHLQSTSSSSPQPPPSPQLQSQASRVVHIPLDHVYRVLPPSDQNSNHSSRRRRRSCLSSTCSRVFLILVICFLVFAIIAGILYLSINPRNPAFFIQSLSLKFSSSKNQSGNYYNLVIYNLSMEASNPNGHIGFYYFKGGRASLSYNKEEIAHGEPPGFYNGKRENRVFHLVLNSSSETLSKVFAKTVMRNDDNKHLKEKVPLVVFIRVPVKIKLGKLKLWKMKMKITCDVSISLSFSFNNIDLGPRHCKNTIH